MMPSTAGRVIGPRLAETEVTPGFLKEAWEWVVLGGGAGAGTPTAHPALVQMVPGALGGGRCSDHQRESTNQHTPLNLSTNRIAVSNDTFKRIGMKDLGGAVEERHIESDWLLDWAFILAGELRTDPANAEPKIVRGLDSKLQKAVHGSDFGGMMFYFESPVGGAHQLCTAYDFELRSCQRFEISKSPLHRCLNYLTPFTGRLRFSEKIVWKTQLAFVPTLSKPANNLVLEQEENPAS
uniref:Uncharacterized protein n=1 Tax=Sphaerodactylus townsendi TaxID=933632 RepID=A0ACB8EY86_9SAUR